MTILGLDTFSGSFEHILKHVPDVGSGWFSNPTIQTDGLFCSPPWLIHASPFAVTGGPYYIGIADVADFSVQASWYIFDQWTHYRLELFGRYNATSGSRVRLYASTASNMIIEDYPGGTQTIIVSPWNQTGAAFKMLFVGTSVKLYYQDTANPTWSLLGEHISAITAAGKIGFNAFNL